MKVSQLAKMYNFDKDKLTAFVNRTEIPNTEVPAVVQAFQQVLAQAAEAQAYLDEDEQRRKEIARTLPITTSQSFEGYRILRYGYAEDVSPIIEIPYRPNRGPENATEQLRSVRQTVIQELKEATVNMGCNAVIALDFDYFSFEHPSSRVYAVVIANGTAVQIEPTVASSSAT